MPLERSGSQRGGGCPALWRLQHNSCEGLCLLLSLLVLVPSVVTRSAPQNGNAEQIVAATFTCQQLIKGLTQEPRRFSLVEISGNVTCINEDWHKVETLKIKTDLIIRGDTSKTAVLDLGGAEGVIEIHPGATLLFMGLTILQDNQLTESAIDPNFHFPLPVATTMMGGRLEYQNVLMGYRNCGNRQLKHTYWREYLGSNDTVHVCNTANICGEGIRSFMHAVPENHKCGNAHHFSNENEHSGPLSQAATLALVILLPGIAILALLIVVIQFRQKLQIGPGLYPRRQTSSSILDVSQPKAEIDESQTCMLDSERDEHATGLPGDNISSPVDGNEYSGFPADDGLLLDMEWVLGMGSNGSRVYKGKYHGHTVAVRIVECAGNPDDAWRTPREVKVNKKLSHANVVKIIFSGAFFTGDGKEESSASESGSGSPSLSGPPPVPFNTFVVMEHCEVGSLQSAIQRGFFVENCDTGTSKLDARLMMMCMLDVARGMQHMHENGLIHAALHPKNVFLKLDKEDDRGFFCKIGDFCLSRKLPPKASYVTTNNLSDISVMPPETLKEGVLSMKADVYSFGIMLWILIAQQAPYDGLLCKDIRMKVIGGSRPKIPAFIDEGLSSLMVQCWHHDPQKRPTFSQVVPVLEGLTRQYAPRLRIGLHRYLDSITSAESEDEGDEDDHLNTSRYLKIRFDPSIALCDGDDGQTGRSQAIPPEVCRALWARSDGCRTERDQLPHQESIRASGAGTSESGENLGPRHMRRESQAKAHEAFVRAVDEMIQQSKRSHGESSLNEFLDALKFHVKQQENSPTGEMG